MDEIPRWTTFWENQKTLLREAHDSLNTDTLVLQAFHHAVEAFGQVIRTTKDVTFPLNIAESEKLWQRTAQERMSYNAAYKALTQTILTRHPAIAHVYGLSNEIIAIWVFTAVNVAPEPTWGWHIEHFLPKNPLARLPDGSTKAPPGFYSQKDMVLWVREMRDYERSLKRARQTWATTKGDRQEKLWLLD